MQQLPTADEVRAVLRGLDDTDRKVVGGLLVVWIAAPDRVRDREWTAEQFVHLATVVLGGGDPGTPATSADVERVADYARRRLPDLVRAALQTFLRVAADLQAANRPFGLADAQAAVRGYLG